MEKEWHSLSKEEVSKVLDTNIFNGLTEEQVEKKRKESGLNEIVSKK